jgi:hypothetical protein
MAPFDSTYKTVGTSYKYNQNPWNSWTLLRPKDPQSGVSGKKADWLSEPSRYVLLHEPPATPYFGYGQWYYFFWHFARGPATLIGNLANLRDHFISPALFADGHVRKLDFTRKITSLPQYPYEPASDWYFYEPAQPTP